MLHGPGRLRRGPAPLAAGPIAGEPAELRTDAGTVLLLTLANRDEGPHTLVVDELNVLMLAGGGQEVTAEVRTGHNVRGSFAFYCQVPGHRSGGMEGRIRVTG